jgi:pimeloyl-ACP methyl ester carboxylesterase
MQYDGHRRASPTREDVRSGTVTSSDGTTGTHGDGQYAEVNGLNLYYETHGAGPPMVLLHGGLGSGEMFGPTLPTLAEHHQVILPDLQGHGRTADIDRPIDPRLMADDIAALIDHLGLDRPDLVGFSLGGWVALHTAAKYPAKVGRLVMASANTRPDAIYPEMRLQQGPGERGRGRVHDRHPDVPALPAGGAPPRGLPPAAGQDRRGNGQGLRLH